MHLVSSDSPTIDPHTARPSGTRSRTTDAEPPPSGDRDRPSADTPAERIVVRPWHDPSLADAGEDPRGEYVERFWLGVVGPSV